MEARQAHSTIGNTVNQSFATRTQRFLAAVIYIHAPQSLSRVRLSAPPSSARRMQTTQVVVCLVWSAGVAGSSDMLELQGKAVNARLASRVRPD
jgi:hypothetical protein